ncbi:MAG TPA: GIY-YIG nuclease family protein [Chitinophagales bacterium]|nr:GIY-YIG nuclease family protein [Chitinophagales bacterium]HQD12186.1 GIY-YIG nuclease family protein [Chitinophagales bacterium]HQO32349.1 GIY-YIG nuclease family protein [Chitinophagales bacterium]
MYYVYILESLLDGDFYKGYTSDYIKRLEQHNNGESDFTKTKMPWRLVFLQAFETKKEALIQEKKLKKCNKQYLVWLISQPVNQLNQ